MTEDIKSKLIRAINTNILVYDDECGKHEFSARLLALLRAVGRRSRYGKIVKITIPQEIPVYGDAKFTMYQLKRFWVSDNFDISRRQTKININKELNNTVDLLTFVQGVGVTNALGKTHFGIVEYENETLLCGI